MFERLMTDERKRVTGILAALFSVTLLLWLIRGPRPFWINVPFLAVSMLLTPLAYFAVYGILYLSLRGQHISVRVLRMACGFCFVGAVTLLTWSTGFAIYDFATHRPMPAANFLALGLALGSMKAWDLQRRTMAPR